MEAIIDYALVLVFFLALLIFVIKVLLVHPYSVPASTSTAEVRIVDNTSTMISYVSLSILLAFLIVITILNQRQDSHAHST